MLRLDLLTNDDTIFEMGVMTIDYKYFEVLKAFVSVQILVQDADIERTKTGVVDRRTTQDESGLHHVRPIATDGESVLVICPHCQQVHAHRELKKVNHGKCKKGAYIIER